MNLRYSVTANERVQNFVEAVQLSSESQQLEQPSASSVMRKGHEDFISILLYGHLNNQKQLELKSQLSQKQEVRAKSMNTTKVDYSQLLLKQEAYPIQKYEEIVRERQTSKELARVTAGGRKQSPNNIADKINSSHSSFFFIRRKSGVN